MYLCGGWEARVGCRKSQSRLFAMPFHGTVSSTCSGVAQISAKIAARYKLMVNATSCASEVELLIRARLFVHEILCYLKVIVSDVPCEPREQSRVVTWTCNFSTFIETMSTGSLASRHW